MPGTGKKNLYWLFWGFLLCGGLRILLYGRTFGMDFSLMCSGFIAMTWGVSVQRRVTDQRLRRLLVAITALLVLNILLHIARYSTFNRITGTDMALDRHLWYAYYIPLTAIPVLCFRVALLVNRPDNRPLSPLFWLLPAASALLTIGVITNDLHFAFVSFPDGILIDDGSERNGWLFYAVNAFIYGAYTAAFLIMLKKSLACHRQKVRWLPVVPLGVGLVYFVLFPLKIDFRLLGFRIWNIGEMVTFAVLTGLESCIQTGLIPANMDYEKLFPLAKLSAAIMDANGQMQYASGPLPYPFPEDASLRVESQPVPGGSVQWAVDISRLTALNQALEDASQKLDARNAYLSQEAQIKAEKSEIETRNAIYDRITRVVQPQLARINALLDQSDLSFEQKMRPITVMSAYIKRRSNMELAAEKNRLSLNELAMAALETAEVLRQCGINAASSGGGSALYSAPLIIHAYEQIETVVEDCFPFLSDLMISLQGDGARLTVRMMLVTDALNLPAPEPENPDWDFRCTRSVTIDGKDVILLFSYTAGGEDS